MSGFFDMGLHEDVDLGELHGGEEAAEPAAAAASPTPSEAAQFAAQLCGACGQHADSFAHNCYRRNVEPDHDVSLHSAIVCDKVVMPIEGFYFCDMMCLHTYNAVKEQHGITDLMPDDGPGDQLVGSFQLPARRRPGGAWEAAPEPAHAAAEEVVEEVQEVEMDEAVGLWRVGDRLHLGWTWIGWVKRVSSMTCEPPTEM